MAPPTAPFFGVSHHAFISGFHRSCVLHNRHIFVLSPGISSESNFSWGVGSSVGSSYGRSSSRRPGRGQQGWQEQRRPPSTTAAKCSASSRGSS